MPKDACFFTPPLQSHQIKHSSTNSSRDKYMLCTVCCYITGVYTCVLRYMFEYGRDGWKKSIKMIFPRDTPRAWAVKGDWAHSHSHGGVALPPPYLLQAQSKPVGKGCCHPLPHFRTVFKQPAPVWSDRKKNPLLPALLATGALAEQEALQSNFGWWRERWLEASWWRQAILAFILTESSENKKQLLKVHQERKYKQSCTHERDRENWGDQHELKLWHRASMWHAVWKLRTKQKAWNKMKLKTCF